MKYIFNNVIRACSKSKIYRNSTGFTLIELLVVISIIALLVSILMPALSKSREQARSVVCKTHLRSIGVSISLYTEDFDGRSFDTEETNSFFWKDDNGEYLDPHEDNAYWGLGYLKYIEDPDIFECPSFLRVSELIYPVDPLLIQQAAFGLNSNFSNKKIGRIRSHSTFIVTHDHVEPRIEGGSRDMFYNDKPGDMNLTDYRDGGFRSDYYRGIFRHNITKSKPFETGGKANILWLDNHVDHLDETTGDNVQKRWYTGVKSNQSY